MGVADGPGSWSVPKNAQNPTSTPGVAYSTFGGGGGISVPTWIRVIGASAAAPHQRLATPPAESRSAVHVEETLAFDSVADGVGLPNNKIADADITRAGYRRRTACRCTLTTSAGDSGGSARMQSVRKRGFGSLAAVLRLQMQGLWSSATSGRTARPHAARAARLPAGLSALAEGPPREYARRGRLSRSRQLLRSPADER